MKHVDFAQRLGHCCMVSQAFKKAATAATNSIELTLHSPERTEAMISWMHNHGNVLSSLWLNSGKLSYFPSSKLKGLKELSLLSSDVQVSRCAGGCSHQSRTSRAYFILV